MPEKMKPAICYRCGKNLRALVPEDATEVICFKCDQVEPRTIRTETTNANSNFTPRVS